MCHDVPMYQTMAGIFFGSEPTSFCGVAVFELYRLYPCLNHPSGVLSFLTCINITWESVHKAVLNHQKMASNPPEIVKIQGHHFFNAKWLQQKKTAEKKNAKKTAKKQLKWFQQVFSSCWKSMCPPTAPLLGRRMGRPSRGLEILREYLPRCIKIPRCWWCTTDVSRL